MKNYTFSISNNRLLFRFKTVYEYKHLVNDRYGEDYMTNPLDRTLLNLEYKYSHKQIQQLQNTLRVWL